MFFTLNSLFWGYKPVYFPMMQLSQVSPWLPLSWPKFHPDIHWNVPIVTPCNVYWYVLSFTLVSIDMSPSFPIASICMSQISPRHPLTCPKFHDGIHWHVPNSTPAYIGMSKVSPSYPLPCPKFPHGIHLHVPHFTIASIDMPQVSPSHPLPCPSFPMTSIYMSQISPWHPFLTCPKFQLGINWHVPIFTFASIDMSQVSHEGHPLTYFLFHPGIHWHILCFTWASIDIF